MSKYFIDFEAAQFAQQIISVGCIDEAGREFYSLVKPHKGIKVGKFVEELTGITDEMLINAPSSDEVFSDLFDWLEPVEDEKVEIYCYGDCDKIFAANNLTHATNTFKSQIMLSLLNSNLIDYSKNVKKYFEIDNTFSLIKLINILHGKEEVQEHNALDDAKYLKEIYDAIAATTFPRPDAIIEISEQQRLKKEAAHNLKKITQIKRISGSQVIETYDSMKEAVDWVVRNMCTQNNYIKDNIVKKIEKSSKNKTKYGNYRWKIVRGD